MVTPGTKFASLNNEQMAQLQALEEELGVSLLAFEIDRTRLAKLNEEQLARLHASEEKLGVILVAYQQTS